MYSEEAATFTPEVEETALALAAQAAVGLASARSNDEIRSALASRDIIGQAKGIIMESYKVASGEAFILLTKLSQDSNTPIYEVARKPRVSRPVPEIKWCQPAKSSGRPGGAGAVFQKANCSNSVDISPTDPSTAEPDTAGPEVA